MRDKSVRLGDEVVELAGVDSLAPRSKRKYEEVVGMSAGGGITFSFPRADSRKTCCRAAGIRGSLLWLRTNMLMIVFCDWGVAAMNNIVSSSVFNEPNRL